MVVYSTVWLPNTYPSVVKRSTNYQDENQFVNHLALDTADIDNKTNKNLSNFRSECTSEEPRGSFERHIPLNISRKKNKYINACSVPSVSFSCITSTCFPFPLL